MKYLMPSYPLVSVVVSTYNQEKYLGDCLQALVENLTSINAEVLVADDFSSDGTRQIAQDFQSRFPQLVRVLVREKNLGANLNYLSAHNEALGKYVAHIDGDDIPLFGKIKRQVHVMEGNPEVALVVHSAIYFSDSGESLKRTGFKNHEVKEWEFSQIDLAAWGPVAVHSSFMYRRQNLCLSSVSLPFMEWSIAMNVLRRGKGVFINEALVKYRSNLGGSSWTASKKGREAAYDVQWENIKLVFDQSPSIRCALYAQVVVNALGIVRGGYQLPKGMIVWLIKKLAYFRAPIIFNSIKTRMTLMPRPF